MNEEQILEIIRKHPEVIREIVKINNFATKRDIKSLYLKLKLQMEKLKNEHRERLIQLENSFKLELEKIRAESNEKIFYLENHFNERMKQLENNFKERIALLENYFNERIVQLENNFNERIMKLESNFKIELEKIRNEYNQKLQETKISLIRWIFGIIVGLFLGQTIIIVISIILTR